MEGLFACSVVDPPGIEPGSLGVDPCEVTNDWARTEQKHFNQKALTKI